MEEFDSGGKHRVIVHFLYRSDGLQLTHKESSNDRENLQVVFFVALAIHHLENAWGFFVSSVRLAFFPPPTSQPLEFFLKEADKRTNMLSLLLLGLGESSLTERSGVSMFCDMSIIETVTPACIDLDETRCETSYQMRCTDDDPLCSSRRCRYLNGQCLIDERPSGCICLTLEPGSWASDGVCVVQDGNCAAAPRTNNLVSAVSLHSTFDYGHMQPWAQSGCATRGAFFHVCDGAGREIQNAMVFIETNDTARPWLGADWLTPSCPDTQDQVCSRLRSEFTENECCSSAPGRRLDIIDHVPTDGVPASDCPAFFTHTRDHILRCQIRDPDSCEKYALPSNFTDIQRVSGSCDDVFVRTKNGTMRRIDGHWVAISTHKKVIDMFSNSDELYGLFERGVYALTKGADPTVRVSFGKQHIQDSVYGGPRYDYLEPSALLVCDGDLFVMAQSGKDEGFLQVFHIPDVAAWGSENHFHATSARYTFHPDAAPKMACIDSSFKMLDAEFMKSKNAF